MALVTSTAYSLLEGVLEKFHLRKYFVYIVTGEKVKKTKPDPEIYLLALKTCAAKPEQTVSIEDSYNGLLSSIRAHIPTIAMQNQHLAKAPESCLIVKNWNELLTLFRNEYEK